MLVVSLARASAACSRMSLAASGDLGLIVHRQSSGYLHSGRQSTLHYRGLSETYERNPSDCLCSILIGAPSSSTAEEMSKTWSKDATLMNRESRARYLPAQILHPNVSEEIQYPNHRSTNLLPCPKMKSRGSRILVSNFPSLTKRSGRNAKGSGYTSGSCMHAL